MKPKGTIVALRRKYPRLVHQVEHSLRLKFRKKPTLRVSKGGRPRDECLREHDGHGTVTKVVLARVTIPKRMAKEDPKLAELAVLHELRENLLFQRGRSQSQAHRKASKMERGDRKRLGLKKSAGWLFRDHYGWKREEGPFQKLVRNIRF